MSVVLSVLLIVVSILSMIVMMRKIRHSKFQIEYSVFWILFSLALIAMAVFPDALIWLAKLTGVSSPVNMIYLIIIFILILKLFYLNLHVSQLEYKVKELIQKIALNDYEKEHSEQENNTRK